MADEYQHVLVPVDCSPNTPLMMEALARFIGSQPCRVTLAAAVSAAPTPEIREKRRQHAQEALDRARWILREYGIYPQLRIAEGSSDGCDPAETFARIADGTPMDRYDVVLLGTHQTQIEEYDYDLPCRGSFADRLCRQLRLPAVIIPAALAKETK